ncbi:hypothetical protein DRW48_07305 [Paracoccus suum]|uniref:Alpha/beta hydrolase n=1 Tax=Paracoccus suum TaxID=2259340 RepID=A0A344PJG3_9RHOB|nr:hypothetical protein [Paracoccus suum]AXC49518.1 hypothetical protein DRW48_07305 [Paracoccus suum]
MALVVVNAGEAPPERTWQIAAALPAGAPIVVMIHGYRFSPHSIHDPHNHILGLHPPADCRRAVSWPRALGFGNADDPREGLAVAFGWEARGRLRTAYGQAAAAGADLGPLVEALASAAGRPVAMIGHSLGARVALEALGHTAPGAAGRLILLAAAEMRDRAEVAIASPAGQLAEVINVTSRENDLYDFAMEIALSAGRRPALGFGLSRRTDRWLDLQIDASDTLAALKSMGFPISGQAQRYSHWSPYLRDGLFELYAAALRQPEALPLWLLRRHLPTRAAPRWSRLLARPWGGRDTDAGGPHATAA